MLSEAEMVSQAIFLFCRSKNAVDVVYELFRVIIDDIVEGHQGSIFVENPKNSMAVPRNCSAFVICSIARSGLTSPI